MALIHPHFVKSKRCPLETLSWVSRTSEVVTTEGELQTQRASVIAPNFWSQTAIDVAVSKYLRKAGVPQPGGKKGAETSIRDMIERVVGRIAEIGVRDEYFAKLEDAEVFKSELKYILAHQIASFNSPVWFNLGLFQSYGIKGPGGHFRFDPETQTIVETDSAYEYPQTSACFIQSVEDHLESIFELAKKEAKIFKYGSGTGTNFSPLRGKKEKLAGGGTSSGLISFLEVLDRGAGATKSGGITRRAAKMVCLDADHPDVFDFVRWKAREEKKAKALIQAGLDSHFEGESYASVSGQHSNNSVRLGDAFFVALEKGGNWATRARTTGEIMEQFPAQKLWDEIAQAVWECADPGLQFDTTIQKWHTCAETAPIRASNPCSEYMFLDETACNLASLNLVKFLDATGQPDWDSFRQAARVMFVAQDILVQASSYPTAAIAENTFRFRPLGLGYTNLGALLMRMGFVYGSAKACELVALVTAEMQLTAQQASREMAEALGVFPEYEKNKTSVKRVFGQSLAALEEYVESPKWSSHFQQLITRWSVENELLESVGLRNAQLTVIAPTGTIGLLMDCDTLGIEPEYSLIKFKKLSGGGEMILVNQSVRPALQSLHYTDDEIEDILLHVRSTGSIQGAPHLSPEHRDVFLCAIASREGEPTLKPEQHLAMMAAAQPFLSGAMSKTVNLPESATVEDIQNVYWTAWKLGLKSIAVYRDGSKASQPLNRHHLNQEIAKSSDTP